MARRNARGTAGDGFASRTRGGRLSLIASPLALPYIFPMTSAAPSSSTHAIARWLVICAAMVFIMVVLGGATRLTESGLSIVEWKPLTLTPPLSDAAWAEEFAAYQGSPQFQKENSWMTVDDFKGIYWLEYLHRLWGRIIGVVFAVPFAWFLYKRAVDRDLAWKLAGLFVLGGAQGALGWFMVASGLVDRPDVSQYRLAAHLLTALVLYAALLWTALDLIYLPNSQSAARAPIPAQRSFARWCGVTAGFVLLVMVSGAFVAGLDAGKIYNTFPLMEGALVPGGLYSLKPWYLSVFEDIKTVQFDHRVLALTLVVMVAVTWARAQRLPLDDRSRKLAHALLAIVIAQASIGISTLLTVVNLELALSHQAVALTLFSLALGLAHAVRGAGRAAQTAATPFHLEPAA